MSRIPLILVAVLAVLPSSEALAQSSLWKTYTESAQEALNRGDFATAEKQFKAALKAAKAFAPEDPRTATSLAGLADTYAMQEKHDQAEPLLQKAIVIWEKSPSPDPSDLAGGLNKLGEVYRSQARYAEAEPLYRRALALLEKTRGPEHADIGVVLNNLGLACTVQGRYPEAEPLLERALAILEKAHGARHVAVAAAVNNLGRLRDGQGRYADAEQLYRRSLAVLEETVGRRHPFARDARQNLATVLRKSRRDGDAAAVERAAEPEPARGEAGRRYAAEIVSGRLRVHLVDPVTNGRTLIRARADARKGLDEGDAREIAAREVEPTKLWDACKARLSGIASNAQDEEHDAWLEVVERLEERLEKDPDHLGILRDLLVGYTRLLSFEARSTLGANICLVLSNRLRELEEKAAPLEVADRGVTAGARAWLLYTAGLYPLAARETAAAPDDPLVTATRAALAALGQAKFSERESFIVGPFAVRVSETAVRAPDPDLLFGETHFVVSQGAGGLPDRCVAYTLTGRGGEGARRYYLTFRALNQSRLVAIYGADRPSYPALRQRVEGLIQDAVAESRGKR